MLAEARQRKKWSVDPRNSTWTNDEKRYGLKMLQKMGWNKGKGLGINEDGKTSHIEVTHKVDNKGLGCKQSHENNWIAHQDNFSSLLHQLNKDQDPLKNSTDNSETCVTNLEKQSKLQKGLYYHKFSKGKNLSLYKQEDMSAIFGTQFKSPCSVESDNDRETKKKNDINMVNSTTLKNKIKKKKGQETQSNKTMDIFINSKYNVEEYFKLRQAMKLCKKSNQGLSTKMVGEKKQKLISCKPKKGEKKSFGKGKLNE